ncbi:hypothetical protein BO94DRAFT_507803 [Aspergillus sclerotioniger CBS 115572]|uniref:Geranylgeranyl pyrophosphate synthetase n=1 Tax=Aspergillus sclerotioniger CBS 115572 TaxID=1450535 RepID=A0A317X8Q0_9EURO|nr:hypothetical protein BO94DRAFT_507803 [Aspergillus sclerotioniger CBS 115572]PWY94974.1 hypothetical protein BO94DRAFT_507803 [Aspergillus sclerotioniger CBS 115572]
MPRAPLRRGLLLPIGEIPVDSIHADPTISASKKDLKTITSYNLLPKRTQTMIVPGTPAIWKPVTTPRKLKPDAGKYILDPNGLVFPKFAMEPLLRAIAVTQPRMKLNDVDLITDRRNLRLLLAFVSGQKKEFRINVEVVESTVFLSTWAPVKTNFVSKFEGYGHEFESVSTWKPRYIRDSIIHARSVGYTLGGIKMLLRFEVDACMPARKHSGGGVAPIEAPTGIKVVNEGTLVGPSRIVEIKTGPVAKRLDFAKNMAQMWFSQTPFLCKGNYEADGTFLPAEERNVEKEGRLAKWEEDNKEKIQKLVRVLQKIFEVVRCVPHRCALVHEGDNTLKVYQDGNPGHRGIPEDLLAMWDIPAVKNG